MTEQSQKSEIDARALKALGKFGVGFLIAAVWFQVRSTLQADSTFIGWTIGVAVAMVYGDAIKDLLESASRRAAVAVDGTLEGRNIPLFVATTFAGGVLLFTTASIGANFLSVHDRAKGNVLLILVGLVLALVPLLGPPAAGLLVGGTVATSLGSSGWNVVLSSVAGILLGVACTAGWFYLNIAYGPVVYQALVP